MANNWNIIVKLLTYNTTTTTAISFKRIHKKKFFFCFGIGFQEEIKKTKKEGVIKKCLNFDS